MTKAETIKFNKIIDKTFYEKREEKENKIGIHDSINILNDNVMLIG